MGEMVVHEARGHGAPVRCGRLPLLSARFGALGLMVVVATSSGRAQESDDRAGKNERASRDPDTARRLSGLDIPPEIRARLQALARGSGGQLPDPALRPGAPVEKGVAETLGEIESAGGRQKGTEGQGTSGAGGGERGPSSAARDGARSAFELQLEAYVDPLVGTPVRQFGYSVFSQTFPEVTDSAVGPDYVLGTGDELVVSIWGAPVDDDYRVSIDREGEVRLPQIGPVPLKGSTLEEADAALRRQYDGVYNNYNLQVRLGRVRDMAVHAIGRVGRPGRVRVPSVATLFDALSAAGGVTKHGSLRGIAVRRRGEEPRSVDLYEYLLEGDLSVDISLSEGDAVVVPPAGSRVAITGRVLRPAIYELSSDEISFAALLDMAGGYARLADRGKVQIESAGSGGLSARVVDLSATDPATVMLRDGDVAIVQGANPRVENVVYVAGNVAVPGRYAYREGMRVSDVLTHEALIEAGFWLERKAPAAAEPETPLPEPFLEYALIRRITPESRQEERIAFHLGKAILEEDPEEDPLLQPQDTIIVFPRSAFVTPDMVSIAGAVHQPNDYRFFPGMRVRDLVRMAGGLLPEAYLREAVLTRVYPDEEKTRFENIPVDLRAAMASDASGNLLLQRHDSLSVRVVPEFRKPYRVEIEGEVRHPGTYTALPGERLSDILRRAGGFTDAAYLPGIQFYRTSVRELQQERLDQALKRLELETATNVQKLAAEAAAAGDETITVEAEQKRVQGLIARIRETPAKGRMVLRVKPPAELEGTPDDIAIEDGDRMLVPRRPDEVNVVGAVFNQTALLYEEGLTAEDYIRECGGPTDTADMDLLFVVRADGTADSADSAREDYRWDARRGRYSRGSLLEAPLYPGDTVVVPYDVKPKLSKLALTKTVTQIIFQAALATGVVVALL